jgi:hypothetical protein
MTLKVCPTDIHEPLEDSESNDRHKPRKGSWHSTQLLSSASMKIWAISVDLPLA